MSDVVHQGEHRGAGGWHRVGGDGGGLALETRACKLAEVNCVKLAGGFVGSFDGGIGSGDFCKSCFCSSSGLVSSLAQALK